MSTILFNGPLSGSFVPTKAIALVAQKLTLDFEIAASGGPTTVQWYVEFADAPTGPWFREIAQEDSGQGQVLMPAVVRTFANTGGMSLTDGTYRFDAELVRQQRLARVQLAVGSGAAKVKVTAPFGIAA
jgi:hypothetical protein